MNNNHIYIITPVYKRLELTKKYLASLKQQSYNFFTVVIVDHCKTDTETMDYINTHFPEWYVIKGDDSMWWTAATNYGIKYVFENFNIDFDNDLILTINNDLTVDPDYLHYLLEAFQQNRPCLIGSLSVDIDDPEALDFVGCKWNKFTTRMKDNFPKATTRYSEIKDKLYLESDFLPGRGMLIPVYLFKKIGFFDEVSFPHYVSDLDFSYRALTEGYKLIVATRAVVRSEIKESGDRYDKNKEIKPSLRFFIRMQKSIKSPINIRNRYNWAKKHTRWSFLYFVTDSMRIILNYSKYSVKYFLRKRAKTSN